MPFIPHTGQDVREMLATIGVDSIEALFDEIPRELLIEELADVPEAVGEREIARIMHRRAARDGMPLNFIGAGAYEHHIPAAIWQIASRGEFYSAYTPYQAEASQGTLQLIYEYQSMMASLTGLDVSNASLYDGASALAEACLMAVRANRRSKSRRMLLPATLHPHYARVAAAICSNQSLAFDTAPFCSETGCVLPAALERYAGADVAAVVVQQPNFFGMLEDVDAITDWAHRHAALLIAVVNPTALAVLRPPGEWGEAGADIACGEGQPLGVPLASGGPYFGFMTCRGQYVRQMPGRIVGRTVDLDGRPGYALTLQAREQHIRRSKATSNICTNQGLLVTAATIYLALVGAEGLARVAARCHAATTGLVQRLEQLPGVHRYFRGPFFHEAVLSLEAPAADVLAALARREILGGLNLAEYHPGLGEAILVCATETKSDRDLETYAQAMGEVLAEVPGRPAGTRR